MRILCLLAAAVLAATQIGGQAEAAGPLQPFQYGLWKGGAYTSDETGAFTHCVAGVPYRSGIYMMVSVNRQYQWSLGFYDPDWALKKGEQISVELYFDGGPPIPVMGSAIDATVVEVPMPDDGRLIGRFRAASQMEAIAEQHTFFFNLNGTSQILPMVALCVKNALQAENANDNSSSTANVAPGTGESLDRLRVATNFLLQAHLKNARIVSPSEVSSQLAALGTVWRADEAVGAVKIYTPSNHDETGLDVVSRLVSSDAEACRGKFASSRSNKLVDADPVFQANTQCLDKNTGPLIEYFVVPWQRTKFAIFTVVNVSPESGTGQESEGNDDVFRKAALKAMH